MRNFEMDKITEVEMPPLSKRPRLDIVENEHRSSESYDKIRCQEFDGKHAEAGFHCKNEESNVFDQSKNGVTENNMADVVSVEAPESTSDKVITETKDEDKENGDQQADDNESDISELSNLSGESEFGWRPIAGPMSWVQEQIISGKDPRVVLRKLVPDPEIIPDHLDDITLWRLVVSIVTEPPSRKKLKHINTIDDVVSLLKSAKKIMVLTGAGVSVSCGIPDFRSRNGIYARLAVDFPDLPDPQAMFDIKYFKHDPRPFFKFAKEIYPGQFEPSHCHKFISLLERQGKLLRNYTQNIDTLEQVAGITKVIQCHGSFAAATCRKCNYKVDAEDIREDIFNQVIPHCPKCTPSAEAIMKPDIVFFGESLPEEFHSQMAADKDVCDLLIVVGSSLKVRPVALIPNSLPPEVPQILINREPLSHLNFDVELLGDCDVVLGELCHMLGDGWSQLFSHYTPKEQVTKGDLLTPTRSESDPKDIGSLSPHAVGSTLTNEVHSTLPNAFAAEQSSSDASSRTVSQPLQLQSACVPNCEENGSSTTVEVSNLENSHQTPKTESQVTNSAEENLEAVGPSKGDNRVDPNTTGGNSASTSVLPTDNPSENVPAVVISCNTEWHTESSSKPSVEDVRNWWQSKHSTISSRLSSDQFLFVPPNRYVFSGAEVYSDDSDNDLNNADDTSDFDDFDSESETKCTESETKSANVEKRLCDTVDSKCDREVETKTTVTDPVNSKCDREVETKTTVTDPVNSKCDREFESKTTVTDPVNSKSDRELETKTTVTDETEIDIKSTKCEGKISVVPDKGTGDFTDHKVNPSLVCKSKSETVLNNQHCDFIGNIPDRTDSATITRTETLADQ